MQRLDVTRGGEKWSSGTRTLVEMLITMIPLGSSSSNELCSLSWWSVRWTYIYLPMALHCNRCWQVFQKKYWTQDCEKKTCSILVVSCVFCNKEVSSSMVETYCTSHPDNSLTSFGDQKLHIINSILGKCETETWLAWSPRHPNPSSNSWMDQERPQKKRNKLRVNHPPHLLCMG